VTCWCNSTHHPALVVWPSPEPQHSFLASHPNTHHQKATPGRRDGFLLHFEAVNLDLGDVTASASLPLLLALATLPGKQGAPGRSRSGRVVTGPPSPLMTSSRLLRLLPDQVLPAFGITQGRSFGKGGRGGG